MGRKEVENIRWKIVGEMYLVENFQKIFGRMGGDQLTGGRGGRVDCWRRVDWGDELTGEG